MFQRILVPIDGSPTSNLGLRQAIKLAADQKATLFLLHVVDEMVATQGFDGTMYVTAEYVDEFIAALRKSGNAILAKAAKLAEAAGVKAQTILAETVGHAVADVIIAQARKSRADVIVLGTHGRRGLTRIVMGSDAEGVIRATTLPVLLVRAPAKKASSAKRRQA